MAEAPLLELTNITRLFGSDPPVAALREVNLAIQRGESVAVVGPSGSGKSTLLNVLGLLDRATSGSYQLDGVDITALSDRELAALRGARIGFVFQSFHLLSYRTTVENVMLAEVYLRGPRAGRRGRAIEMLERVGMGHRLTFLPSRLSGGERQRVAIARALMGQPAVLLCDEPTGNLDSVTTADILGLFEGLVADGITMLIITHDDEVASHSGRRMRMVDGELRELTVTPPQRQTVG